MVYVNNYVSKLKYMVHKIYKTYIQYILLNTIGKVLFLEYNDKQDRIHYLKELKF